VETQPPRGPVYGVADTHAHQFSNLAFGGALFWGSPFDERGINAALAWGDFTWDFPTTAWTLPLFIRDRGWIPTPYFGHEVHFDLAAGILGVATEENTPHNRGGGQSFKGWPRFNTTTHQQMYYRWLERAYKGGLRLAVMLAVNNEVICELPITRKRVIGFTSSHNPIFDCDDMYAVDLQLQAYRDLEEYIDRENDGQANGNGWYRIVETPYEARQAIRAGKMAVVLGIEVDGLFGCEEYPCDRDKIDSDLDFYVDHGVRHFFPVHLYDNGFGASAIYNSLWPIVSPLATGNTMVVDNCENVKTRLTGPLRNESANYKFNILATPLLDGLFSVLNFFGEDYELYDAQTTGHCNDKGLTDDGEYVIDEMMDRNLIIDADHFSMLALDRLLKKATLRDYPLISGHSFLHERPLTERGRKSPPSEGHKTKLQIETIRDLGGIVAPLNPRFKGSSTRDYVHMYKYIVELMKENTPYGPDYPAIGYASDWGAMFQQTAPRCTGDVCCPPGSTMCPGLANSICKDFSDITFDAYTYPIAQCEGRDFPILEYPFKAVGVGGTFNKQQTGDRIFDFNEDGLAHVGLLPDFFKDLTYVGLTEDELEPLFHSAEVYIRMWEKINGGPPVITPLISGTLGNNGWYVSDVTVSWQIVSESTIYETDGCDPVTIDYDTAGVTLICFVASDGGEAEQSITIKRDATHTTFSDNLSGTDTLLISEASSNEPDSLGKGDKPDDIQGFEIDSDSTSGELRAQRHGGAPGRIYSLGYAGHDMAGNATVCTTHVNVPHDEGKDG
jgi:microsomal dipeptidase-like Zn-dependent dipeptidase